MGGDPLRKVLAGERLDIPAAGWNAAMDAARAEKNRLFAGGDIVRAASVATTLNVGGAVMAQNNTGSDIPAYYAAELELIADPQGDEDGWYDALPLLRLRTGDGGIPAVACQPIRQGAVGAWVVAGLAVAKLYPHEDEDAALVGAYAMLHPSHEGCLLQCGWGPFRIWTTHDVAGKGEGETAAYVWALVGFTDFPAGEFDAKITGHAEADTPAQNRWVYEFVEVEKTAAGYGGYTTLSGGRHSNDEADPPILAYNKLEDGNDGEGRECNGTDVDNLEGDNYSAQIEPCPDDTLVTMRTKVFIVDGEPVVEYEFDYENGVDGSCDEEE